MGNCPCITMDQTKPTGFCLRGVPSLAPLGTIHLLGPCMPGLSKGPTDAGASQQRQRLRRELQLSAHAPRCSAHRGSTAQKQGSPSPKSVCSLCHPAAGLSLVPPLKAFSRSSAQMVTHLRVNLWQLLPKAVCALAHACCSALGSSSSKGNQGCTAFPLSRWQAGTSLTWPSSNCSNYIPHILS